MIAADWLDEPVAAGNDRSTAQDKFTFTASDGSTDGNLATVDVTVCGALCAGDCYGNGQVAIDELVRAINAALHGC